MPGALDHSPADIVRRLFVSLSLGTLPSSSQAEGDWPIHAALEPDSPDSVITIYDTEGVTQGRIQIDGEIQEQHGIQVRIRARSHQAGYPKANDIVQAMDKTIYRNTVTIGSDTYLVHSVTRTGGILSLGKQVPLNKLNLFTINALVSVRQTGG